MLKSGTAIGAKSKMFLLKRNNSLFYIFLLFLLQGICFVVQSTVTVIRTGTIILLTESLYRSYFKILSVIFFFLNKCFNFKDVLAILKVIEI